jgi:hypothetical protein
MSKKIAPKDNSANMGNANKGTPGTNKQHDQVQGNRGKQLAAAGPSQQSAGSGSGSGSSKQSAGAGSGSKGASSSKGGKK